MLVFLCGEIFLLCLYFVTSGKITFIACAYLLVKKAKTFHIAEEQTMAFTRLNRVVSKVKSIVQTELNIYLI